MMTSEPAIPLGAAIGIIVGIAVVLIAALWAWYHYGEESALRSAGLWGDDEKQVPHQTAEGKGEGHAPTRAEAGVAVEDPKLVQPDASQVEVDDVHADVEEAVVPVTTSADQGIIATEKTQKPEPQATGYQKKETGITETSNLSDPTSAVAAQGAGNGAGSTSTSTSSTMPGSSNANGSESGNITMGSRSKTRQNVSAATFPPPPGTLTQTQTQVPPQQYSGTIYQSYNGTFVDVNGVPIPVNLLPEPLRQQQQVASQQQPVPAYYPYPGHGVPYPSGPPSVGYVPNMPPIPQEYAVTSAPASANGAGEGSSSGGGGPHSAPYQQQQPMPYPVMIHPQQQQPYPQFQPQYLQQQPQAYHHAPISHITFGNSDPVDDALTVDDSTLTGTIGQSIGNSERFTNQQAQHRFDDEESKVDKETKEGESKEKQATA